VVIELAGHAALARDLAAGGVFVPGCTLAMAQECELVVCGAHHQLSLPARVVYIDEQRGAGLELIGFSTAMRAQLAELAPLAQGSQDDLALPTDDGAAPIPEDRDDEYRTLPVPTGVHAVPDPVGLDDDLAVPVEEVDDLHTMPVWTSSRIRLVEVDRDPAAAVPGVAEPPASNLGHSDPEFAIAGIEADAAFFDAQAAPAEPDPMPDAAPEAIPLEVAEVELDAIADAELEAGPDAGPDAGAAAGPAAGDGSTARAPRHVHERLRGLTLAAQLKLAASGELHERIVLERLYGKNVWETLLRNPRLTPPEVSRIARYGALPRVLLEIILGNATWLQVPEVRRALLTNPRLGTDQILKVLRLTPRHELRLAAIQTAYPHAVRQAARLLLRGE
jgi:hypothetical protein